MTIRDVKEYLKGIKSYQQYLERLKKRRASLHLDVSFGGIDYSADRIQSTPKNKMEEAMVRLSDRLEKLDNLIAKISVEIDDRISSIENLKNETHRNILFKRYVENKSFEVISIEMGYAYNYTCNLHGDALRELSKVLNFS
jgi:seryl-tRNA synthetase